MKDNVEHDVSAEIQILILQVLPVKNYFTLNAGK